MREILRGCYCYRYYDYDGDGCIIRIFRTPVRSKLLLLL